MGEKKDIYILGYLDDEYNNFVFIEAYSNLENLKESARRSYGVENIQDVDNLLVRGGYCYKETVLF